MPADTIRYTRPAHRWLLVAVLLLGGCSKREPLYTEQLFVFGTLVEFSIWGAEPEQAREAASEPVVVAEAPRPERAAPEPPAGSGAARSREAERRTTTPSPEPTYREAAAEESSKKAAKPVAAAREPEPGADLTLESLLETMTSGSGLSADFVERKELALLSVPLESRGLAA